MLFNVGDSHQCTTYFKEFEKNKTKQKNKKPGHEFFFHFFIIIFLAIFPIYFNLSCSLFIICTNCSDNILMPNSGSWWLIKTSSNMS
jgi:hypothetical protein